MNTTDLRETVRDVIAYDDARESAPFEHEFTLLAGLALLQGRGGGMLLARSASGRDGLRKWSRAPQQVKPRSRILVTP